MNIKIDIVYSYVDGSDKNWQYERTDNFNKFYNSKINNFDSNTNNRFKNHNELLYSLRSVHKYMNFINKIYIVINHDPPKWLNLDNDKIIIVYHKDIKSLQSYLPTFNSHTIEAHLHNIENLEEYFLYFNDDIIINDKLELFDFINLETGKISIFLDKNYTRKGIPNPSDFSFRSAWKNGNKWLDNNYKIEKRKKMAHVPILIKKSIMLELASKFDNFHQTCVNKFRSINDYNVTCSLYPYYLLYNNLAEISTMKTETYYLNNDYEKNKEILKNISNNVKIFCLEDDNIDEQSDILMEEFFKNKFPNSYDKVI